MSRGANQRFKLSFLREILLEETDNEHTITMVKEQSGVAIEHSAISRRSL